MNRCNENSIEKRFCWTCHGFRERWFGGEWQAPEKCQTPIKCVEMASQNPPVDGVVAEFK